MSSAKQSHTNDKRNTEWYTVDVYNGKALRVSVPVLAQSKGAAIGIVRKKYLDHKLSFKVQKGVFTNESRDSSCKHCYPY